MNKRYTLQTNLHFTSLHLSSLHFNSFLSDFKYFITHLKFLLLIITPLKYSILQAVVVFQSSARHYCCRSCCLTILVSGSSLFLESHLAIQLLSKRLFCERPGNPLRHRQRIRGYLPPDMFSLRLECFEVSSAVQLRNALLFRTV
jgi:hypothetical protein